MAARRIVVAVDFGTTYSGVAWSETGSPDHQTLVETWPDRGWWPRSSPKVPTELRVVQAGYQWGFEIPENSLRKRRFKLKLNDSSHVDKGPSPKELTTEYLKKLYAHSRSVIENRLTADVVASVPIDFVVTVPAIWSDRAKQATKAAAEEAGFRGQSALYMVSEPEAAAMYTLKTLHPSYLQVGNQFVVCDAGGGTVDLITYRVTNLHNLTLKEVTQGTGGMCGSSMLNERFRRHLKTKHGEEYWTNERLVEPLRLFEQFKKGWRPDADRLFVDVDPSLGVRRNRYVVPESAMAGVFEPVIRDVIDLVQGQVQRVAGNVRAVLLVGGFGQNAYLGERVKAAVASGIEVLTPENGWTAVVRGAALLGMNRLSPAQTGVSIASRVARAHYGILLSKTDDDIAHHPQNRVYRNRLGIDAVDVIDWFINKGESYAEGSVSSIPGNFLVTQLGVLVTPEPIKIYTDAVDLVAPAYENANTRVTGQLRFNQTRVLPPFTALPKITNDGVLYYKVPARVEARYGSAAITYSLKIGETTHDIVTAKYLAISKVQHIAALFQEYPQLVSHVAELNIMGGAEGGSDPPRSPPELPGSN